MYFGKIVLIFHSWICLGNRHGEPTNSTDAVKICRGGRAYNRHGKYQGRQFIDQPISFLIFCLDLIIRDTSLSGHDKMISDVSYL